MENNQKKFTLMATGELTAGQTYEKVVNNIQNAFSLDREKAIKLLTPNRVIKRNLPEDKASKYVRKLRSLGVVTRIIDATQGDLPTKQSASQAESSDPARMDFDAIFGQPIPRQKVHLGYTLGLILTSCLSLITPVIYIGLICLVLYAGIAYAMQLPSMLASINSLIGKVVWSILPFLVLGTLTLFMLKPFFIRSEYRQPHELKRKDAPQLFSLVEALCNRMGVPAPAAIHVNDEVNASAGPAGGLVSLLQRKLRLTIGVPLLTGMSTRQLCGVLAHEFGHFAQPTAMLAYGVINRVNYWFATRIYYDDPLDHQLKQWENAAQVHLMTWLGLKSAQYGIVLTRKLLKLLFGINNRITQYLSRQMEYDADVYEGIVAGSDQFRETAFRLRQLHHSYQQLQDLNSKAWNENKLVNDLFVPMVSIANSLPQSVNSQLIAAMDNMAFDPLSSHPADNDRIDRVKQRNEPGIFRITAPASSLCADMPALCKLVTLKTYHEYGLRDAAAYTVPYEEIAHDSSKKQKAEHALQEFFNDCFTQRMISFKAPLKSEWASMSSQQIVSTLRSELIEYRKSQDSYFYELDKYQGMVIGAGYLKNGVNINPSDFSLQGISDNEMEDAIINKMQYLHQLHKRLYPVDALFVHRMKESVKGLIPHDQQEFERLLQAAQAVTALSTDLFDLKERYAALDTYLSIEDEELLSVMMPAIQEFREECWKHANLILNKSTRVPCGLTRDQTLKAFIINWCGEPNAGYAAKEPGYVAQFAEQVIGAVGYNYYWVMAHLAELATKSETQQGVQGIRVRLKATSE